MNRFVYDTVALQLYAKIVEYVWPLGHRTMNGGEQQEFCGQTRSIYVLLYFFTLSLVLLSAYPRYSHYRSSRYSSMKLTIQSNSFRYNENDIKIHLKLKLVWSGLVFSKIKSIQNSFRQSGKLLIDHQKSMRLHQLLIEDYL
ncbi:hypothetical protein V1477_000273 [Vespula maculifrons]|uniref:Transmembrane protein n=1 Tax=Vespula maculifrons TaxID=7453 RepID=A0ABD2D149_VESMC